MASNTFPYLVLNKSVSLSDTHPCEVQLSLLTALTEEEAFRQIQASLTSQDSLQ